MFATNTLVNLDYCTPLMKTADGFEIMEINALISPKFGCSAGGEYFVAAFANY